MPKSFFFAGDFFNNHIKNTEFCFGTDSFSEQMLQNVRKRLPAHRKKDLANLRQFGR